MSDDDLIRRRDAEDKVCPFLKSEFAEDAIAAIRALPATDARADALREAAAMFDEDSNIAQTILALIDEART